jgi:hypothetical protein
MRTWDVFFPDVLPDVLGCPEPTVERHLLRAAADFCRRSRCLRQDLDRILTRIGKATYDIRWPDGTEGVELIDASLDGVRIELEVADATSMADRRAGVRGRNRVLSQDLLTVTLMPTPAVDSSELRLAAILTIAEGAEGVPDAVGDRYRVEIATGALASLLKINKAPWANSGLAMDKAKAFEAAIDDANSRAWKANTNRRPRVRGQFY